MLKIFLNTNHAFMLAAGRVEKKSCHWKDVPQPCESTGILLRTSRYFKRQIHYFLNRLFKMPVSDESLPMCVQDQIWHCQRTFLGRVTEILVTLAKISLGSLVSYWITFSLMHKSTTGWENFWSGVVYVGILQLGFCNWSPASWAHGWAAFTLWSSLFLHPRTKMIL